MTEHKPTPVERAQRTLGYLASNGKMTEQNAEKFLDLLTDSTKESRARWAALPWYSQAWWRTKQRVRGWFGLRTKMPYHVDYLYRITRAKVTEHELGRLRQPWKKDR